MRVMVMALGRIFGRLIERVDDAQPMDNWDIVGTFYDEA